MVEIIRFDDENILDILNGFKILIDRFNKYHMKWLLKSILAVRSNIPLVLNNVVMIEAHSKYYVIHYKGYVKIMDARTARKHFHDRKIINFVRVNKNYIVNIAYIEFIDQQGYVHLQHVKNPIKITDAFKDKLL